VRVASARFSPAATAEGPRRTQRKRQLHSQFRRDRAANCLVRMGERLTVLGSLDIVIDQLEQHARLVGDRDDQLSKQKLFSS
jgi:hypothetical protein